MDINKLTKLIERAEDMQRRMDEFRDAVYAEHEVEVYDDIEDEDVQILCERLQKASDGLESLREFFYDSVFI